MSVVRRPTVLLALSTLLSVAAAHGNHGGEKIEEGETVSADPIVRAELRGYFPNLGTDEADW